MVAPQILDQYGKPIKRSELAEPQTSKLAQLHREFASHPARGLTPARLARILEDAEQGDIRAQHDLFLDMEDKDAHIFAEMGKRKRALLTVDWDIVPPRNASATERKLAGTLTRDLVYPLLALNKGGVEDLRRLPKFKFVFDDSEELGAFSEALPKLVGIGMRIPEQWAHGRAGIPLPEGDERVLGLPPNPDNAGKAALAALSAQDVTDMDEFDVLADELASDWERVTDPLISPIAALAEEVSSFEEFQARLPDLIRDMDADKLAEALAQGQFAARIWGKLNAAD
ncbi:MAG: DUF935 family protein [Pseudomonadota bacterium]